MDRETLGAARWVRLTSTMWIARVIAKNAAHGSQEKGGLDRCAGGRSR
jgi:hypothetical protein